MSDMKSLEEVKSELLAKLIHPVNHGPGCKGPVHQGVYDSIEHITPDEMGRIDAMAQEIFDAQGNK